jgi:hypothetical protein
MGTKANRRARGRAFSEDRRTVECVGVQIERSTRRAVPPVQTALDEPDFVELTVAGMEIPGEFRCADCGYGAVVHRVVPLCPMCSGTVWELRGPVTPRLVD